MSNHARPNGMAMKQPASFAFVSVEDANQLPVMPTAILASQLVG
jgi:hypothetical protein